jgi:hypothetical protein
MRYARNTRNAQIPEMGTTAALAWRFWGPAYHSVT